ncbi:hypothetical protein KC19_1G111500 [Ceratodon purpureus]|uniref:Uncharacterized protein n=1 Tax=Ceratodon purpureus TaxID=3225 RepID=A0A8T0J3U4_CERPU|nr:hypothetical protein KC19_1G111500 [Ceratodon purpureus]
MPGTKRDLKGRTQVTRFCSKQYASQLSSTKQLILPSTYFDTPVRRRSERHAYLPKHCHVLCSDVLQLVLGNLCFRVAPTSSHLLQHTHSLPSDSYHTTIPTPNVLALPLSLPPSLPLSPSLSLSPFTERNEPP